jgi:hypothetical protein
MCVFDVWAWKFVFDDPWRNRAKFAPLYGIRLAGEALNNVTPILDIGGEPLKILWLEKWLGIPRDAALKSVVVGRTALFLAEVAFATGGLFLFARHFPLPQEWRTVLTAGAAAFAAGGAVLLAVLKFFKRFEAGQARFTAAFVLHLAGWAAGGVEMFFIFRILGCPITFFQAIILESLLQLVRLTSFFIPANLGAQESGLVFLAGTLGFAPAVGVAASLLKRARQLVWTAAGFVLWGVAKTYEHGKPV